jgi:hypothetical protein
MLELSDLHNAVAKVCPIISVSGDMKDRTTWLIDFDPLATDIQITEANKVLSTFDPTAILRVTAYQARLALLQAGLYDQVVATVSTADKATQIWWEYSLEIEKDHPILTDITTKSGIIGSQLDSVFKAAVVL